MENKQIITERWDEYVERVVAGSTGLGEAAISELREELATESLMLELEDLADSEKQRRLVEMAKRLLARCQKSAEVAQTVVAELAQPAAMIPAAAAFPVLNTTDLPEVDEPHQCLEELLAELRQHGDYQRIRQKYCQLSIMLNLQGLLAPAFRPPLVTGKKFGDRVFNAIHRDQLVIDCHWLNVTNQFVKVRAKDVEFAPMFGARKPFPFELAWDFANKKWTADHRAIDMLRLTEFQQYQLAALRSDAVKQRVQRIEHGSRKDGRFVPSPIAVFEQGLNAWCERDRRIQKHRDGYVAVWKARSFLGEAATVRQVGKLAAMMLGAPPKDDKTTRAKEEKIRRHISGE